MIMGRRWLMWGHPLGVHRNLPFHGFPRDAALGMQAVLRCDGVECHQLQQPRVVVSPVPIGVGCCGASLGVFDVKERLEMRQHS